MGQHKPVLLDEAIANLVVENDGFYVDCTFGRGGHSSAILKVLGAKGRLLAFDRDADAVNSEAAIELQKDNRFNIHHGAFTEMGTVIERLGVLGEVNGVLIDLGVSSPQLDTPERGFSFLQDGPLDMRMDTGSGETAAQWLANVDEKVLTKILFEYGEERYARRIAKAVIERRKEREIETTGQLAQLIEAVIPWKEKHKHPATRSFQAIRIAVNDELRHLQNVLMQSLRVLKTGGRLVVISFHSLEDRLVKRFIREQSRGLHSGTKLPLREDQIEQGKLMKLGKPYKPSAKELDWNPRARSAVMRVAQKR